MSLCINPNCPQAQKEIDQGLNQFCFSCGSSLIVNDSYRVERRLGAGGFGVTYLVSDAGTPKVLKVLHNTEPKAIALFEQEARVLQRLNHVGIPKVERDSPFLYKPNGSPPLHCLVMEWIEGEDLESYMKKRNFKPLSEKAAIPWLRELVEILDVVPGANYFHRDSKYRTKSLKLFPSNAFSQNTRDLYWVRILDGFAVLFLIFYSVLRKYFNGDNDTRLGANHQTGWTGLVATLIHHCSEDSQSSNAENASKLIVFLE